MQEELVAPNPELIKQLECGSIISIIKKSQMQNGLKHNSYHDYRHYCQKKIKKLRTRMGLKFGRKTYTKKEWKIDNPTMIEHLHVPLYNCEKYWAYAMELRQVPSTAKHTKKLKYNIRNKLKKSLQWSKEFSSLCGKLNVKRATLEADSIHCYLEGLLQSEYKNYEQALEYYMKSKKIMMDLKEIAGVIEKAHLQERIEQVEHNIRFCKYNLRQFDSNMQNELMEMQNLIMQDSTLADKLEDLVNEVNQAETNVTNFKIQFFDKEVEVQNIQVVNQIKSIDILGESVKTKIQTEDEESVLNLYLEIFSKYDEAMKICNKEVKEKATSEAVQKIWDNLNTYLSFEKNYKVQARNEVLLNQLRKKFIEENGMELLFNTKTSFKHVKPQDQVKLCDNILLLIKQNKEIIVTNEGRAPLQDTLESYYSVYRCFFVSCYHVMSNNYLFAISLLSSMEGKLDLAISEIQTVSGLDDVQRKSMGEIALWIKAIAYEIRVKSHVTLLEENFRNLDDLTEDLKDVEIKEGKKIRKEESLFDIVKNGESLNKNRDKGEVMAFVNYPPEPRILPPKPILLDVCTTMLTYPNIEDRIPEVKEEIKDEGLLSKVAGGVWGWFGGKK